MKKQRNKGFSMVELIVVIAIMVVLLAVLAPSLLKYVENSRMQKDESAMAEVCNAAQLALADSNTFDEVFSYAVPKNYTTYSDSSGVYGAKYTDEEFWAPDGSGTGVTITFNPDENGNYYLADGQVNNMTFSNGSVGNLDIDSTKQTRLEDMGDGKLYAALKKSIGTTINEKSATYKNSSYTMFIEYELTNGIYRPTITGAFNGTNLTDDAPAAIGGNTTPPTEDNNDAATPPVNNGNNATPDITDSDLQGGGSVSSPGNTPTPDPVEPEEPEEPEKPNDGLPPNTETIIYRAEDLDTNISYANFIITKSNRSKIGFRGIENENLIVPTAFFDTSNNTWYKVTGMDDRVFKDCTELNSIILPNTITTISQYAFENCTALTSIAFPDNLTRIMAYAFEGCIELNNVVLPNGITSINGFKGCKSLTSITIPASANFIGVFTFTGCSNLTSVTFEDTNGWRCSGWADLRRPTYISSSQLSNPQTAAKYLRDTYSINYWGRL